MALWSSIAIRARYVNESAGAMLGRPVTKLLGNEIWGEFPEGVRQPCRQACEEATRSGLPQQIVCHDVTDRAGAERALGASERRMRAIIDNTPSLILVKDLDGRYLI
jgi:PAS domain-containing protein